MDPLDEQPSEDLARKCSAARSRSTYDDVSREGHRNTGCSLGTWQILDSPRIQRQQASFAPVGARAIEEELAEEIHPGEVQTVSCRGL